MTHRVLLTGAAGFVGLQILRALADASCAVRAVVRSGAGDRPGGFSGVEIVETPDAFAESVAWWEAVCKGVDTVIHAAWYTKPGVYLQSEQNLHCLEGTLALARGCAAAGVSRFVGIGTCIEYDVSAGLLSTDTPLRPTTIYGDTKAATFLALSHWLPSRDIRFVWCRLFYLYGEGEADRRLVPYLRQRLAAGERVELSSGTQTRDYLDVREAGRMIAGVALGDREGAINICSGVPVTIRELAEKVADEYGRRDLLDFGARPDNLLDAPVIVGVPESR